MKHLFWIPVVFAALVAGCKKTDKMSLAAVSTTTASNITANSAQTGGAIANTGGSAISQSGVCWALHNNPSVSDSLVPGGVTGAGSFTSALTHLNANTEYYVRAYAINGSGVSYGNVDSFMTSAGVPTVNTVAISNINPLIAYSGGSVTNTGGASVSARGICWSTTAHPTTVNFKTSDGSGTGSFADSLTDLASQTVYYVRAYAINSYGTGYGNEISFTASSANTVVDIDGNVYPYIVIGTQTWMAENLRVTHYQNGDSIINGMTNMNFDFFTTVNNGTYIGAYIAPNLDTTQVAAYGLSYNNYAVNDNRGVCPVGWHVPSDKEWTILEFYEGMTAADTLERENPNLQAWEGTIGGNLLAGGSSGLNLQEAGYLYIGGTGLAANDAYVVFGPGGYGQYWTSTTNSSLGQGINLSNYFYGFNPVENAGWPASAIVREFNCYYTSSIRCVKN